MSANSQVVLSGQWLSLSETAAALGKSPKTIEAMVTKNQIKSTTVPRTGRKPERVYEAADVDRLAKEAEARAARSPAVRKEPAPKETILALAPKAQSSLEKILERLTAPPPLAVPVDRKLWLSLKEAAAYSGLSQSHLAELREQGKLDVIERGSGRGVRRRISRKSLEAFEG